MTTKSIRHCGSILEDHKQRAEEVFSNEHLQLGIYNVHVGTNLGITCEPGEEEVVFILHILDGEIHFHSVEDDFTLYSNDSVMLSNITDSYHAVVKKTTKMLMFSSHPHHQKIKKTNACFQMVEEVEMKDIYTIGHSRRVNDYAIQIALALDPSYDIIVLGAAAMFHDIGKYYTPIEILQKPSKLTKEEYEIIKKHPLDTYQLLKESHGERIAKVASQHHERLNGSGYPYGLKEGEISLDAKIIAVADVFDAITCKRVYNQEVSYEEAIHIMEQQSGLYDNQVLQCLKQLVLEGKLNS